jgi:integrase
VLNVIRNYMPQKYQSICLVACCSLLRLSNLVNLRKRDVDFKEGITVIQGRSKKHSVFIPMSDKLRAAFDSIKIWPMRDDDLWFPEITAGALSASAMRKFHKAGIPWGSFHQFRHFGACYLLNKGVPIETVSKWLGHKSIVTTMIYARVKRETLKDSAKAFAQIRTK